MGWNAGNAERAWFRERRRLLCRALLVVAVMSAIPGCGRLGYEELLVQADLDASRGDTGVLDGSRPSDPASDAAQNVGSNLDGDLPDGDLPDRDSPDGGTPDSAVSNCTPSSAVTVAGSPGVDWPSVAWDGIAYGIAWSAPVAGQPEVFFARLDAAGDVVTPPRQVSAAMGDSAFRPDIASDGAAFAITWEGDDETYIALVQADGVVSVPETRASFSPGFESSRAAIAWTGSAYALVWKDDRNGGLFEIYFSTVTPGGTLGPEVRLTDTAGRSQQPALAASNDRIAVAFQDDASGMQHIHAQLIDVTGAPLAPLVQLSGVGTEGTIPSIAVNTTSFGAAWGTAVGADAGTIQLDSESGNAAGTFQLLNASGEAGSVPVLVPFRDGFVGYWRDGANNAIGFRVVDGGGIPQGSAGTVQTEVQGVGLIAAASDGSDGVGVAWRVPGANAIRFMHMCP